MGLDAAELSLIRLDELITPNEVNVAELFNHISHAVEGYDRFPEHQRAEADLYAHETLRTGQQAQQAIQANREIDVYINYYKAIPHQ